MGDLTELRDRLKNAVSTLDDLIDQAEDVSKAAVSRQVRLSGKRDGVNLALSYVEEAIRNQQS